ncbi:MAG: ATP-binding protein [Deltaproteobacteria bacterium]|nr:ATP-binding protein [Deltaproteobacteria bacterium]
MGKSVLLKQHLERLFEQGLKKKHAFFVDKESLEFEDIATYRDLDRAVKKQLGGRRGYKCLFVDEIQEIQEWEKAIVSLAKMPGLDIYISGSNASMLSSELASNLSGRYVEFKIYPLTLDEFLTFRQKTIADAKNEFLNYVKYGGLPAVHYFPLRDEVIYQYIRSLYSTILLKDIVQRYQIRNTILLENLMQYICDNVGNLFSANRVVDYLKTQRLSMSTNTVVSYVAHFEAAHLISKALRYDLKGKKHLEFVCKYFLGDIGLRHALIGFRESELAGVLENIVYLDLLGRGYNVSVGKFGEKEIDFIAVKDNKKIYIQVAYALSSKQTVKREFEPLLDIRDNYPKYVLSLDEFFGGDYAGIKRIHIIDFLLNRDEL